MKRLIIRHFKVIIGHCMVDDDLTFSEEISWRPIISPKLRASYTPDALVQLLKEDPFTLQRCRVVTTINVASRVETISLSRLVLRPQTIPWLNEAISHPHTNPRKERLIYDVTKELSTIGRVVVLNKNHTDCRRENLREISPQEEPIE